MPYCVRCGSTLSEDNRFCGKCGAPISNLSVVQRNAVYFRFPEKQSTNFGSGLMVGAGVVLFVVGLFMAFALNALYNQQTVYLTSQGIQVSRWAFGLENLVFLISTGALVATMGVYLVVLGGLNQFSPTVRAAWQRKNDKARIGNGLIVGGFVYASVTSLNFIRQAYFPIDSGWFLLLNIFFVVCGLTVLLVGALLIRSSYLKSKQPTKV